VLNEEYRAKLDNAGQYEDQDRHDEREFDGSNAAVIVPEAANPKRRPASKEPRCGGALSVL
jgi:hypothetical protein